MGEPIFELRNFPESERIFYCDGDLAGDSLQPIKVAHGECMSLQAANAQRAQRTIASDQRQPVSAAHTLSPHLCGYTAGELFRIKGIQKQRLAMCEYPCIRRVLKGDYQIVMDQPFTFWKNYASHAKQFGFFFHARSPRASLEQRETDVVVPDDTAQASSYSREQFADFKI